MKIRILTAGALLVLCTGVLAVEKTGREFSELIKEMDHELTEAKNTVDQLEEQRKTMNSKLKHSEVLEERGKALRELEKYTSELDDAESPEEKQKASGAVEQQVLKVAKLSADFLEAQKNDLVTQDKQLEVMENALSSVIMKMDRLENLANKNFDDSEGKVDAEKARIEARKNLKKMAGMVEMLAANTGKSQHWRSVRTTIALYNKMLKNSLASNNQVLGMLKTQKQIYEQVLAQISIVREGLQGEKELLGQIALGEVARSLLRKAAGLLLGNQNIEEIGNAAILKAEQRQQNILAFLEQDRVTADEYNSLTGDYSDDYPSGYMEFLNNPIE